MWLFGIMKVKYFEYPSILIAADSHSGIMKLAFDSHLSPKQLKMLQSIHIQF